MKHTLSYYLALAGGALGIVLPVIAWVRAATIIGFVQSIPQLIPDAGNLTKVNEYVASTYTSTGIFAVIAIILAIVGILSVVFEKRNQIVQGIMCALGFVGLFFMGWWALPAALCFFVAAFLAFFRRPSDKF